MTLSDQYASVVDTLRQSQLVDTSLKSALQEILDLKGQHVIKLHARFVKYTNTDETADEGIAFEKSLGVFFVKGEKLTTEYRLATDHADLYMEVDMEDVPGSTTNLGKGEHNTPHLALVAEAIFADNLQFCISDRSGQWDCLRHKQRQAHAQWPGNTDKRADSKAASRQRRSPPRIYKDTHVFEGPYRFCCTNGAPFLMVEIDVLLRLKVALRRMLWAAEARARA